MSGSSLGIALLYPNLLGTYGDAGNAAVLRFRAQARGHSVEMVTVEPGQALPRQADIYLLGGGEDAKQTAAVQMLRRDGALADAVARGAVVFGVCAGYQLLGTSFAGVGGRIEPGLELLDVSTVRLGERAVGNIGAHARGDLADRLGDLIGFENHGGGTVLGPAAEPLGDVWVGVGNGEGAGESDVAASAAEHSQRTEGAVQGRVLGTYLHGPALALNPALADMLLSFALGDVAPLDDSIVEGLRQHRLRRVLPQTERTAFRDGVLARLGRRRAGASGASATLSRR